MLGHIILFLNFQWETKVTLGILCSQLYILSTLFRDQTSKSTLGLLGENSKIAITQKAKALHRFIKFGL